jgi:two-component system nitrogen regulation sensor histidine kinase NtrY
MWRVVGDTGPSALTTEDIALADPGVASPSRPSLRLFGAIAVVLALLSATVTFLVLVGLTPILPTHRVVVTLLLIDLLASLLLIGVIGRELWQIFPHVGAGGQAPGFTCASSGCFP